MAEQQDQEPRYDDTFPGQHHAPRSSRTPQLYCSQWWADLAVGHDGDHSDTVWGVTFYWALDISDAMETAEAMSDADFFRPRGHRGGSAALSHVEGSRLYRKLPGGALERLEGDDIGELVGEQPWNFDDIHIEDTQRVVSGGESL